VCIHWKIKKKLKTEIEINVGAGAASPESCICLPDSSVYWVQRNNNIAPDSIPTRIYFSESKDTRIIFEEKASKLMGNCLKRKPKNR